MEPRISINDFHNMDQRLTEMEEKINSIDTKLTQVVDAILGNPLTKVGGFVNDIEQIKEKISELEKKQMEYENFKNKILWTVSLIVSGFIAIQYILNIYTKFK
jgi:hypothetical protein